MKPRKCYLAGNGSYGCLYDNVLAFGSRKAAEDSLIALFGLGRTRKAGELRRNGNIALGVKYGADYCEVVEGEVAEWYDAKRGEWRDA